MRKRENLTSISKSPCKDPEILVCTYNPRAVDAGREGVWCSLAGCSSHICELWVSVRDPVSKHKVGFTRGMTSEVDLCVPYLYMHTLIPTRVHLHIPKYAHT